MFSTLKVKNPDVGSQKGNEEEYRKVLYGVYVGCAICAVCLVITLATYISFR